MCVGVIIRVSLFTTLGMAIVSLISDSRPSLEANDTLGMTARRRRVTAVGGGSGDQLERLVSERRTESSGRSKRKKQMTSFDVAKVLSVTISESAKQRTNRNKNTKVGVTGESGGPRVLGVFIVQSQSVRDDFEKNRKERGMLHLNKNIRNTKRQVKQRLLDTQIGGGSNIDDESEVDQHVTNEVDERKQEGRFTKHANQEIKSQRDDILFKKDTINVTRHQGRDIVFEKIQNNGTETEHNISVISRAAEHYQSPSSNKSKLRKPYNREREYFGKIARQQNETNENIKTQNVNEMRNVHTLKTTTRGSYQLKTKKSDLAERVAKTYFKDQVKSNSQVPLIDIIGRSLNGLKAFSSSKQGMEMRVKRSLEQEWKEDGIVNPNHHQKDANASNLDINILTENNNTVRAQEGVETNGSLESIAFGASGANNSSLERGGDGDGEAVLLFLNETTEDPLLLMGENGDFEMLMSCKNQCGEWRGKPCSCGATCFVYKNCCEDAPFHCPSLEREASEILGKDLKTIDRNNVECHSSTVFMVTRCPDDKTGSDPSVGTKKDESLMSMLENAAIVYDNRTGVVFRNSSVYLCYVGDSFKKSFESLRYWTAEYEISKLFNFRSINGIDVLDPVKTLKNLKLHTASYYPESSLIAGNQCMRDVISTCREEFASFDPDKKCGKFVSYYEYQALETLDVYQNKYCFFCNTNMTATGKPSKKENPIERSFPLSVTLNFNNDHEVFLKIRGILSIGWLDAKCTLGDSQLESDLPLTNPDSHVCNVNDCGRETVVSTAQNSCEQFSQQSLLLGQPPRRLRLGEILRLSRFIACYIENKHKIENDFIDEVEIKISSLSRDFVPVNIKSDAFFTITLEHRFARWMEMVSYIPEAVEDAVLYWYMKREIVVAMSNGLLIYKEYVEDFSEYVLPGGIGGVRISDHNNYTRRRQIVENHPDAVFRGKIAAFEAFDTYDLYPEEFVISETNNFYVDDGGVLASCFGENGSGGEGRGRGGGGGGGGGRGGSGKGGGGRNNDDDSGGVSADRSQAAIASSCYRLVVCVCLCSITNVVHIW